MFLLILTISSNPLFKQASSQTRRPHPYPSGLNNEMESFTAMPALSSGATTTPGDALGLNAAGQSLGMDAFDQDLNFDDALL